MHVKYLLYTECKIKVVCIFTDEGFICKVMSFKHLNSHQVRKPEVSIFTPK